MADVAVVKVKVTEDIDEEIRKFLGMELPRVLGYAVVEKLDREGIEAYIPDRPPFLSLKKAVILESTEEGSKFFAVCRVDRQECEGHFGNGHIIVPLLSLVKAMALTGSVLASYLRGDDNVALAVGSGKVYMPDQRLMIPPLDVLTEASPVSVDKRHCLVKTTAWLNNEQVAVIEDLDYLLMKRSIFHRFYKGEMLKKGDNIVGL